MNQRDLARVLCRLLAVYLAVRALAALPGAVVTLGGSVLNGLPPLVYGMAATALWFGAGKLSGLIVRGGRAGRLRRAEGETLLRAVFIATGVLILIASLGSVADLASALLSPSSWLLVGLLGGAVFTQWAAGIALMLAARSLAAGLSADTQRGLVSPVRAELQNPEEASAARLVSELVSAAGELGVRRLTDLAQSIRAEAEGVAKRVVRSSLDAVIAAVEQRRPDFSGSTAADGTVTIVFSDMEGFTAMTQRLGDHAAHQVIKAHNHIVRRAVRKHGGQEVELQGDGFLLAFPDPAQALLCAGSIQRQCAEYSRRHPQEPIRVRIGLHCGTPIKEGDRFFGITVILAARIASIAAGGEILVSDVLHQAVAADRRFVFVEQREAELKGLSGRHRMHCLDWAD